MKKSTLSILMLLTTATVTSFAQDDTFINKGKWLAGGNVSLSITNGSDWVQLVLSPYAGYFVSNRIALGLTPGFSHYSYDDGNTYVSKYTSISAGIFARYYFSQSRIAPFGELAYGGNWLEWTDESTSTDTNSYFRVGAGLNYFLNKNVAIEGILKYSDFHDSTFSDGLSFNVGLQFFFGGK